MTIKTMVATKKVFDQNGVLKFPGELVQFDTNPKRSAKREGEKRDNGLADVKSTAPAKVVAISAIAPTGPNPVSPQQLPAGANQSRTGFVSEEGEKLVAEGSEAAIEVEEGGAPRAAKPAPKADAKPADAKKDSVLS